MFVMMNSARLHVGLQGLGHLDAAWQNAHAYALERVQGRGRAIARASGGPPHALAAARAGRRRRVVAYWCAQLLDEAHHHPDAARRQRAEALVSDC